LVGFRFGVQLASLSVPVMAAPCPVKLLEHTSFVKLTDHPVPLAQLEFHFVLADTDQECKML
jgi:hypothetical protein